MTSRKPLYAVGEAVLKQLQVEAMLDHSVDDDCPAPPDGDALSNPQSRRPLPVTVN